MQRLLSTIMISSGLMLLLLASLPYAAPLAAQGDDELPPRPTLTPMPELPTSELPATATPLPATATPPPATATPLPATATPVGPPPPAQPDPAPQPSPTPLPAGRITGTVIDLTTGAPVAGVAVQVGTHVTSSNSDGNYNIEGLPTGNYTIELLPTAMQGTAAQGPITVALLPGATVVQHLALRSPPQPSPGDSEQATEPTPPVSPEQTTEPTPPVSPEQPPISPEIPVYLPITAGSHTNQGLMLLSAILLLTLGFGVRWLLAIGRHRPL
ncbi:carboxypeptidase regulatory-like domain-containing protein [Candidatus Viridilinea mediisalina]|uniref:Carboxypeptidase regulatory-like domain-containing protein n=1 Tax=Candidatus Viridilinea mediisalina TaxID=2024553 RepID=A0A2A6RED7_9CHLR|nr:carboxypeptidase regulatory-like domain-containing protein [Candidatus Viridilinea mediisalina]PDW00807.1 hypothetical protein CJ255_20220 [Candidatus Viridilinea mediisalina]